MVTGVDRTMEKEAAEALLDRGVSVPLKPLRLPFVKRGITLRLTMRRPTLAGLMEIARLYLKMGVSAEEMESWGKARQMEFLVSHGCDLSRMIACTVCRGYVSGKLLRGLTAWLIRHFVEYRYQMAVVGRFVSLVGTDPFVPIIRLAGIMNPMTPRLSQKRKGS